LTEWKETVVNQRVWTGVVAGVLAATLLLTVGIGAYNAGQDDNAVTRVVSDTDGDVVRVVDHGWGRGPGFGFFLFPLFVILLIALLARGRGWRGGWHRHWGHHGYGPGPGPYGREPEETFDEWHRRSHERAAASSEGSKEGPQDIPPTDVT
jgi:hypothetical protein